MLRTYIQNKTVAASHVCVSCLEELSCGCTYWVPLLGAFAWCLCLVPLLGAFAWCLCLVPLLGAFAGCISSLELCATEF